MNITLPLDCSAIERILPHRYPFLLVDRITELEPDKRIVGIKNVTLNERYLAHRPGEAPVLPPTILTEAVAQVGAILILAKPENRDRLPFFVGIERVRYRRPVHPGDVVEIEAVVKRLRSRMGVMHGIARVQGQVVVEGTMTFALRLRNERRLNSVPQLPKTNSQLPRIWVKSPNSQIRELGFFGSCLRGTLPNHHHDQSDLHASRRPGRPLRVRMKVPPCIEQRWSEHERPDPAFVDPGSARHPACVALRRARPRECDARIGRRRDHVEGEDSLGERRALVPQVGAAAEQPLVLRVLDPEARRRDDEFATRREPAPMRDREKRDAVKVDLAEPGLLPQRGVGQQVAGLMGAQPEDAAYQKRSNTLPFGCIVVWLSFRGRLRERTRVPGCNRKKTQDYAHGSSV